MDHIYPKSRGGENSWRNYTAACANCNRKKGENSLLGYLLKEYIPDSVPYSPNGEPLPGEWSEPLALLGYARADRDFYKRDERFVGLGSRERKHLRMKLANG